MVTAIKLLGYYFWFVGAYELLKESDFQLFSCGELKYQIIFAVG